jgi:hypothetical protein
MFQQSEQRTSLFGFGAIPQGIKAGIPRQRKSTVITDAQWPHSIQEVDQSYRYEKIKNDIKGLEQSYEIIDSIEIRTFIFNNPFLIGILNEAHNKIRKIFGEKIRINLEMQLDPEENYEELFIVIRSFFSAKKARRLMDRLDDEWFLKIMRDTRGKLCITEEPYEF